MNLEAKAKEIRRWILETALKEGKGHVASCLSWVEIAVALFYGGMDVSVDRFVLSKVHGHLTLDAVWQDTPLSECVRWPGWPYKCSGSLGQGLSIAAGMALAKKISNEPGRVFCVLSDAELHEGNIWEAVMFAAHHKLNNLVAIIDDNGQACANFTKEVLNIEPLNKRLRAFGWSTATLYDGHHLGDLASALGRGGGPHCVIAKTTKGKGIPFMEGKPEWHHQIPKGEEIEAARRALA